jgi:ABC-type multidrug transport system fused ATPase/permease subunit
MLGETVTYKIRVILYGSLLSKNIGWFDLKENGTSVLTSSMAEDTAIVNMAAGQSVGPILEGMFALFGGLIIALINCWQYALICMVFISIWIGTMTI